MASDEPAASRPADGRARGVARARPGPEAGGVLALHGISKAFPGVQALADVSFDLRPGEVHALIGENGAGKSTLLKILSGAHPADVGRITVDGHDVLIASPRAARQLGIAVIYQELMLVPWLSVAHNLFLGRERAIGRGVLSLKRLHARARDELGRMGFTLDPAVAVAELGVAAQQMVEIARALGQDARFLLMDEPTAALTEREVDGLFEKIDALRQAGVGVLYISHRIDELARIADHVTVLRDGAVVFSGRMADVGLGELIAKMVGRPIGDHYPPRTPTPGIELLRVEPPPATRRSRPVVVRTGEVVGLAGLVGAGRTEWAWRLVGASPGRGERVFVRGREVRITSPRLARDLGIGMVPEDRKGHGLVLSRGVRDNITLAILDRLCGWAGFLDRQRQAELSRQYVDRFRIRCPHDEVGVDTLSGGNQQKVVLAKWLARDCQAIILDEPTRGIDIGAKFEMYTLINELTRQGKAVILISSDLPELVSMSDRVYIVHEGDFVAERDARKTSQEEVMHFASGAFAWTAG